MKASTVTPLLTAAVLIALRVTAVAHHSVSAEFDATRRITLAGTVTKVEWMNPHTYFYVDVKDPKTGSVLNWACELGSPNMLLSRGWKPNTLRVGMSVNVAGPMARDGSRKVNAKNIVADGNTLSSWPDESTQH